jgi:hypothetical protein
LRTQNKIFFARPGHSSVDLSAGSLLFFAGYHCCIMGNGIRDEVDNGLAETTQKGQQRIYTWIKYPTLKQ